MMTVVKRLFYPLISPRANRATAKIFLAVNIVFQSENVLAFRRSTQEESVCLRTYSDCTLRPGPRNGALSKTSLVSIQEEGQNIPLHTECSNQRFPYSILFCSHPVNGALVRRSACVLLFITQNTRTPWRARNLITYLLPFRGRTSIDSQTNATDSLQLRTNNGLNARRQSLLLFAGVTCHINAFRRPR
jgi:hypothetical protein